MKADDRCRNEFWTAEHRRQQRFHQEHPGLSAVDAAMPWNQVIKEATDNIEFWLQELQEPALLYAQAQNDQSQAGNYQQQYDYDDRKGKGKKRKNELAGQGHPRMRQGKFTTNQHGTDICFKFNTRECVPNCQRAHQCQKCLGQHRALDCPKGKGKGKKGKGTKYSWESAEQAAFSS